MIKNFCITGGAGFIGSHFARLLSEQKLIDKEIGEIVIYDKLTYAADLGRLEGLDIRVVEGDICNSNHLTKTLNEYSITHVVHFAAESHVDRSISDELPFLQTNIIGTACVIDSVSQHFLSLGKEIHEALYVHISTDEVYGEILESNPAATEETALNPSNPYAATKAAADQLVIAKMRGGNFPSIIVRSSNNFGIAQHPEKMIPKVIQCLEDGMAIPVYGQGTQKRCWLSANTFSEILLTLIGTGIKGEIFNVCGKEVLSNLELVNKIRTAFAEKNGLTLDFVSPIRFVEDRKYHDFFYHIDDSKVVRTLAKTGGIEYETLEAFLKKVL